MFKYVSFITRKDSQTGQMTQPEGKRKIFISYRHSDEESLPLCEKLADYILEKLDVAIWYDRNLTAGEDYDKEIQSAISDSDVFILLLTPNILDSGYVLEKEIPLAKKNQIPVIPVIAGLSQEDIPKVETYTGRVHMPVWFFGKQTQAPPFEKDAKEQFYNGLQLSIANKDLIEQAKLFYEKGSDSISMRHLTPEQIFVKAYGHLFGVSSNTDKSIGVKLMESIVNMYGNDKEFEDLQAQVSYELLAHLYRVNEPELFFAYFNSAIDKCNKSAYTLLFNIYRNQWHPELLCNESNLSMILFKKLYQANFQKNWDADEVINTAEKCELRIQNVTASENPRIGEIRFDGHVAYLQKNLSSPTEVNLIIDSQVLNTFNVFASYGDVYFVYLAYDSEKNILLTLHADFDHYGPETNTSVQIYKIEQDGIKSYKQYSDWHKGRKDLPYSPYTFNIK